MTDCRVRKSLKAAELLLSAGENLLEICMLLLCIASMLYGLYSVADDYLIARTAADKSILQFKPAPGKEASSVRSITENQIGWISFEGTPLDYPLLQGRTNSEYLNKDPYGEFSYSGSIFLDCVNSPDFSDPYSVIYGHHMSGDMMFGCLDAFREEQYLREHRFGTLTAGSRIFDIELFAAVPCKATDPLIFRPGACSASRLLGYIRGKKGVILDAEEAAQKNPGTEASALGQNGSETQAQKNSEPPKRIILLTTCSGEAFDSRLAVCGFLRERAEFEALDGGVHAELNSAAD